ncbi:hypothetical protein M426DRAFT_7273 [Hypoxylon sp. CI-4A]|nr:hypothetical protein M426DRAFT_7273 [Hypoxylon sp. CI-4A]
MCYKDTTHTNCMKCKRQIQVETEIKPSFLCILPSYHLTGTACPRGIVAEQNKYKFIDECRECEETQRKQMERAVELALLPEEEREEAEARDRAFAQERILRNQRAGDAVRYYVKSLGLQK